MATKRKPPAPAQKPTKAETVYNPPAPAPITYTDYELSGILRPIRDANMRDFAFDMIAFAKANGLPWKPRVAAYRQTSGVDEIVMSFPARWEGWNIDDPGATVTNHVPLNVLFAAVEPGLNLQNHPTGAGAMDAQMRTLLSEMNVSYERGASLPCGWEQFKRDTGSKVVL